MRRIATTAIKPSFPLIIQEKKSFTSLILSFLLQQYTWLYYDSIATAHQESTLRTVYSSQLFSLKRKRLAQNYSKPPPRNCYLDSRFHHDCALISSTSACLSVRILSRAYHLLSPISFLLFSSLHQSILIIPQLVTISATAPKPLRLESSHRREHHCCCWYFLDVTADFGCDDDEDAHLNFYHYS